MSGTERLTAEDVAAMVAYWQSPTAAADAPALAGYACICVERLAAALAEHEGCVPKAEHDRVVAERDEWAMQWRGCDGMYGALSADIVALRTEREEAVRLLAIAHGALKALNIKSNFDAEVDAFLARTDTPEPQP